MKTIIALILTIAASTVHSEVMKIDCVFGNEPLSMNFTYDSISDDSFVVGNNGVSKVTFVNGRNHFSFIEITDSGNVMTTSILPNGLAVHSRNFTAGNDFETASQQKGVCTFRDGSTKSTAPKSAEQKLK
ncbi:MAG: hypothetical protein PHY54_01495 [Methylococcales bacterium]|nr:hypothetical protein [Methylococcales bacterium]